MLIVYKLKDKSDKRKTMGLHMGTKECSSKQAAIDFRMLSLPVISF